MKKKAEGNLWAASSKSEDHVEEIRLAPKKENVSKIAANDNYDFETKKKDEAPVQKKKDSGFGGFSAGFLS